MSYGLREFLKTASNTFIDDLASAGHCLTMPIRVTANYAAAVMVDLETSSRGEYQGSLKRSEMQRQASLNWSRIHQQFIAYKNHFATSPDRNGKYVYYFLCEIEALDPNESERLIRQFTAFIHSNPDLAIAQIGESMDRICQGGLQALSNRQMMALGNGG